MKAKTASSETAVLAAERKLHNTWVYIKRHWQLYLLFLLPAVALTLVFKYAPMGGVLIAFQKYNPFKGIWGSEWVGFKNFTRFMSSPDFQRYLINTLKLSVYGLLWGFPIPILLAFLLNRPLPCSSFTIIIITVIGRTGIERGTPFTFTIQSTHETGTA